MNKRVCFLVINLVFGIFSLYSQQNDNYEIEIVIENNIKTITINGYNGKESKVRIPEEIDSIPVTKIGNGAFADNKLTSIIIPDTVIYIGHIAFENNLLQEVVLSNSITTINQLAFAHNQIKNIIIPNGVTFIMDGAFENNQITEIIIPNSVTEIGNGVFENNPLEKITIGENVELYEWIYPFEEEFCLYYIKHGKKLGTYIKRNGHWEKVDLLEDEFDIIKTENDLEIENRTQEESIDFFVSDSLLDDDNIIGKWYRNLLFATAELTVDQDMNFSIEAQNTAHFGNVEGKLVKLKDGYYYSYIKDNDYEDSGVIIFIEHIDNIELIVYGWIGAGATVFYDGKYEKQPMSNDEYINEALDHIIGNTYDKDIIKNLLENDLEYFLTCFGAISKKNNGDSIILEGYMPGIAPWQNGIIKIKNNNIYILITDCREEIIIFRYYTNDNLQEIIPDEFRDWVYFYGERKIINKISKNE
jgi:hypothetical protein